MRSPISPETPEDQLSLRLGKPKKLAAGIPAAVSSMKHGVTKMGLVKTVKTPVSYTHLTLPTKRIV